MNPSAVEVGVPKVGVLAVPRFTTWLTAELVLVTKLASPPYSAVMLFEPTASDAIDKVAVPDVRVPVPSVVEPFLKVMVPDGVPEEPVTVAVKVTDCPKSKGLAEDVNAVVVVVI